MVSQSHRTESAIARLTVEPSARTLATTAAAHALTQYVDALCETYRLTPAELALILTAEQMRHATGELAFERHTGRTSPVMLRHLPPAASDPKVADAYNTSDAVINGAIGN